MVFFGIGAAAVAVAILCDDLTAYFRNRQLLNDAQEALARLRSLNSEYDVLLESLDADPNLFERLAPAALGIERQEPNTVYPSATLEQLAIARRALSGVPPLSPGHWPGYPRRPAGAIVPARAGTAEGSALLQNSKFPSQGPGFAGTGEACPVWLSRCSEPRRRMVLFFVGAGLILTSFICFGSTADKHRSLDFARDPGSPPGGVP
jgi:hypothetical protein